MHETPPADDEQHKSPEVQIQRRKRQAGPKRRPSSFAYDEHPEIPVKRRASLLLNQQNVETQTIEPERQRRAKSPDGPEDAALNKRPKTANLPPNAAPDDPNNQEDEEVDEQDLPYKHRARTYRHPADNIMVSPNLRRSIYEPPLSGHRPRRRHTQHIHVQRPFLARLEQLRYNQGAVIIGLLSLALLILVPITIAAGRSDTSASSNTIATTSGQPPASIQQAPLNPHELIIMPQDTDHPPPPVFATSAYLLDADTGVTLYAHNPFIHLPMLSTTKLMTATLTIEQGLLDQKITITDAMTRQISQLSADSAMFNVKKGETYTLRDLLYGLLFVSGNDAALIIADVIGGNVQNFVAEMNSRAHQLGMNDTHFMNPHGLLQAGQYSSAHDLAVLGKYGMSLPALHQISGQSFYHIPKGGNHPDRALINENQFLWWYPGVDGGKTGYDGRSDFIQVMSCTRNHHHLIGVVMNTTDWWTDMRDLMNWGFDSFTWISPYDVDFQKSIPFDNLWDYFVKDKKDNTIPTAGSGRYYIYTGFSVSAPISTYFDQAGGLKKFGYPTKLASAPAPSVISQQFEHGTIQCNLSTNQCQKI